MSVKSSLPAASANGLSRRGLLLSVGASAGGMMIGFSFGANAQHVAEPIWTSAPSNGATELNAWLTISRSGEITIRVGQSEMGEGVFTALPMILAEELECDWRSVRAEYASANRSLKENHIYGRMQTGGSSAVRLGRPALQQAGASARERLIRAAALRWKVPATECSALQGLVLHAASQRSLSYGELAETAASIHLDAEPPIKTPDQFRLIGQPVARLDTPVKVNGAAKFGMDIRLPNMLYAAVRVCPVFGGSVKSYDFEAIRTLRGIHSVQPVPNGVAVVADSSWRARTGLDALPIEWEKGPNAQLDSNVLRQVFLKGSERSGIVARKEGGGEAALSSTAGGKVVGALYELPFLAHAAMEPLNCTAQVTHERIDLWLGTQVPEAVIDIASKVSGVSPENIYVNNCFLGGGFGRRLYPDEVGQAVLIAKAVGRPVKLFWTREEDMRQDRYRPQAAIRLDAVLQTDGLPGTLRIRSAAGSIRRSSGADPIVDNLDRFVLDGLEKMPYRAPNIQVELVLCDTPVLLGAMRSVNSSQNAFALESFIDEMAVAAKQDPYRYRRALLADREDWLRVLDTAAQKSGWEEKLPAGKGRGIAIFECYGSIAAEVVEVTVTPKGDVKVDRVVAALDCGNIVNPRIVEAQIKGAIAFGLSATLYGEITIAHGQVEQSNFDSYRLVRMAEMPTVELHMALSGGAKWGGVGEPGVPPLAPALANAIFAATGKRIRNLPLSRVNLSA